MTIDMIIDEMGEMEQNWKELIKIEEPYNAEENAYGAMVVVGDNEVRTISSARDLIRSQREEITRLRRRDVEITQAVEDAIENMKQAKDDMEEYRRKYNAMRDAHTRMIGQIMELIEELKR